jgi:hypothetical protein
MASCDSNERSTYLSQYVGHNQSAHGPKPQVSATDVYKRLLIINYIIGKRRVDDELQ